MGKEHGLLALCSIVIPRTAGPRNSHMVFQTSRAGQPVLNRLLAALHLGGQGERRIFEIFEGSNRLKFTGSSYMKMEKRPFVRLRNPRLLGFRPDKEVNPQALRVSQIPERYLTDYYAWKKNIQS